MGRHPDSEAARASARRRAARLPTGPRPRGQATVDGAGRNEGARLNEALSKSRRRAVEAESIAVLARLRDEGSGADGEKTRVSAASEILKHLSRKEETARRTREWRQRRDQQRAEEARKLERDLPAGGPAPDLGRMVSRAAEVLDRVGREDG